MEEFFTVVGLTTCLAVATGFVIGFAWRATTISDAKRQTANDIDWISSEIRDLQKKYWNLRSEQCVLEARIKKCE